MMPQLLFYYLVLIALGIQVRLARGQGVARQVRVKRREKG
jgi:hypothetical protein